MQTKEYLNVSHFCIKSIVNCIIFKHENGNRKLKSAAFSRKITMIAYQCNRPFSLGSHVESQDNKKLCFCMGSLGLNSSVGKASCAKTN